MKFCIFLDHDVIFPMRSLGKEKLLAEVALALNLTVHVTPRCLQITNLLFETNIFTTSELAGFKGRIRTMDFRIFSEKVISKCNSTTPTIAILPTALYTGMKSLKFDVS